MFFVRTGGGDQTAFIAIFVYTGQSKCKEGPGSRYQVI